MYSPPLARRLASAQRQRIAPLLCERIALRGLCRAVGVSLTGLCHCMVAGVAAWPEACQAQPPAQPPAGLGARLAAAAEERGRVGQKKAHTHWIWIAMDAKTRPIITFHGGERRRDSGQELWAPLPVISRDHATCHTDHSAGDQGVIPAAPPRTMTKHARKTQHIERFNTTLRQGVSRLGRETLSCSTPLAHHLGASKDFLCHSNVAQAGALPV